MNRIKKSAYLTVIALVSILAISSMVFAYMDTYNISGGSVEVSDNAQPAGNVMLGAEGDTNFTNIVAEDITASDDLTVTDDMTVGDDLTITGDLDINGSSTVVNAFAQGGGIWASSTSATVTTGTTSQAILTAYNMLEYTANSGNSTLFLPASSSWTTLLPNPGDTRSWLIHNATTTAATTLTIAIQASGGIDLIAYTTNDDVIDGTEYAELTCWRQADTDITCLTSELLHAD